MEYYSIGANICQCRPGMNVWYGDWPACRSRRRKHFIDCPFLIASALISFRHRQKKSSQYKALAAILFDTKELSGIQIQCPWGQTFQADIPLSQTSAIAPFQAAPTATAAEELAWQFQSVTDQALPWRGCLVRQLTCSPQAAQTFDRLPAFGRIHLDLAPPSP